MTLDEVKALKLGDIVHERSYYYADGGCRRWRVSGKVKLWKRNPGRVEVPMSSTEFGLRDYGCITERQVKFFHLPSNCPHGL